MQYRGSASSDKMEVEPLRLHSQSGDWERESNLTTTVIPRSLSLTRNAI
jgi:hypothetical protein